MITSEQQLAARNATDGKWVKLKLHCTFPMATDAARMGINPKPLFNVVDGDYATGSTISLETCFRLGLRVEVVE